MFIKLMSPKGGRKLNWLGFGERKPQTVTFHSRDTGEPVIFDDSTYALVIGYAELDLLRGQKMYMKYNDCRELYKLLKSEFEN